MGRLILLVGLVIFLGTLSGCTGSARNMDLKKRQDDSIKNIVTEKYRIKAGLREAEFRLNDQLQKLEFEKARLKTEIAKVQEIQAIYDKKKSEQTALQIRNQQLVVQSVKNKISELEHTTNQTRDAITAIKQERQKYR